jgi:hypothetical protein
MQYTTIALPDDFEKGDCDVCPFCYEEYVGGEDGVIDHCVFMKRYDECPIETGETVHIGDKVYKAVKPFHKTTASDGECTIGGFWEVST